MPLLLNSKLILVAVSRLDLALDIRHLEAEKAYIRSARILKVPASGEVSEEVLNAISDQARRDANVYCLGVIRNREASPKLKADAAVLALQFNLANHGLPDHLGYLQAAYQHYLEYCLSFIQENPDAISTDRALEIRILDFALAKNKLLCIEHVRGINPIPTQEFAQQIDGYYQTFKKSAKAHSYTALLYAEYCFKRDDVFLALDYVIHAGQHWTSSREESAFSQKRSQLWNDIISTFMNIDSFKRWRDADKVKALTLSFELRFSPRYQVLRSDLPLEPTLSLFDSYTGVMRNSQIGSSTQRHYEKLLRQYASQHAQSALLLAECLLKQENWVEGIHYLLLACQHEHAATQKGTATTAAIQQLFQSIISEQILPVIEESIQNGSNDFSKIHKRSLAFVFTTRFLGNDDYLALRNTIFQGNPGIATQLQTQCALDTVSQHSGSKESQVLLITYLVARGVMPVTELRTFLEDKGDTIGVDLNGAIMGILNQKRLVTWSERRTRRKEKRKKENRTLLTNNYFKTELTILRREYDRSHSILDVDDQFRRLQYSSITQDADGDEQLEKLRQLVSEYNTLFVRNSRIVLACILMGLQLCLMPCLIIYSSETPKLMASLIPTWIVLAMYILPVLIKCIINLYKMVCDYCATKVEKNPKKFITDEQVQAKLLAELKNNRSTLATKMSLLAESTGAAPPAYTESDQPRATFYDGDEECKTPQPDRDDVDAAGVGPVKSPPGRG